LHEYR